MSFSCRPLGPSARDALRLFTAAVAALALIVTLASPATAANGSLRGRVTDLAGNPVSGVSIWAGVGLATGTTDGSGNYSVSLPAASGYNILADKSGYAKAHQYGVNISGGGTTTLDFRITTQQGTISGRVVDSAGRGVASHVIADSTEGNGFGNANTDANGFFSINRLAPMAYVVHAFPNSSSYPQTAIYGINVTNGATTSTTVVLGSSSASGRISGRVTLPNGTPVPNAVVYVDGATTSAAWNGKTDANGVYATGWLTSAQYNVHVSDVPGYANQVLWNVPVAAGQTTPNQNVQLSNVVGGIAGFITDGFGDPIVGATISAFSTSSTGPWGWQTVASGSDGWYKLDQLLPGNRYRLFVQAPGRPELTADFVPVSAGSTTQPYNFAYSFPSRGLAARAQGGYYVLSGNGQVFGRDGAPTFGSPTFGGDLARGIAVMPDGQGYVVLDAFGGVHKYGSAKSGAMANLGGPYFGWDIARAIAVTSDGLGYGVLDGFGGLHASGTAPHPVTPYFGWDIARSFQFTPDRQGTYILDGFGGVHVGGTAVGRGGPYFGWDIARSIVVTSTGAGYAVLDGVGGIHRQGDAPAPGANGDYGSRDWRGLSLAGNRYLVTRSDGRTKLL